MNIAFEIFIFFVIVYNLFVFESCIDRVYRVVVVVFIFRNILIFSWIIIPILIVILNLWIFKYLYVLWQLQVFLTLVNWLMRYFGFYIFFFYGWIHFWEKGGSCSILCLFSTRCINFTLVIIVFLYSCEIYLFLKIILEFTYSKIEY